MKSAFALALCVLGYASAEKAKLQLVDLDGKTLDEHEVDFEPGQDFLVDVNLDVVDRFALD